MTHQCIAGRLLIFFAASFIAAASAHGQWTITYTYDMQQAETALGAERVGPMAKALDRVKTRLESVLTQSIGDVQVTASFEDPGPGALAGALSSYFRAASPALARDRLVAAAEGASEPQAEVNIYPNAVQYTSGAVPSLIAPLDSRMLATSTPAFEWEPVPGEWSSTLFIYSGADTLTDDPFRVYDELLEAEFTLPISDALPPGLYSWKIVSESQPGYDESEVRTFTVQGSCVADFDGNGQVQVPDIFAFLSAWFASDPAADVDGNGLIQVPDVFTFLSLWFAGC